MNKYTNTIKPTALTTRLSPHNKNYVYVNLCYRMKSVHQKDDYWYCNCIQIIDTRKIQPREIVDMLCRQHNVVFLPGILKGDIVTKEHIRKINMLKDLFTQISF